jgi:hypothetical protein
VRKENVVENERPRQSAARDKLESDQLKDEVLRQSAKKKKELGLFQWKKEASPRFAMKVSHRIRGDVNLWV